MRYHERTKHHFARFAPGPGAARLGEPARSVPALRGRAAHAAAAARAGRRAALARVRQPVRAGRGGERAGRPALAVAPARARARALGLEAGRRHALGAARESLERQPPSHRGLCARSVRSQSSANRRDFSTTRRASTRSSGAPTARRSCSRAYDADSPAAGVPGRASPRSTGARPGSTASAPSATASTTPATPSARCASPRPRSAGRRGCWTSVADDTIEALLGLDRDADFEGAERENAELLMAVSPGRSCLATDLDLDARRGAAR